VAFAAATFVVVKGGTPDGTPDQGPGDL